MSQIQIREDQRLLELFAGKVLGDLSSEEMLEFGELFSAVHTKEIQELELAAAALQLGLNESSADLMPDSLRQKIVETSNSLDFTDSRPSEIPLEDTRLKSVRLRDADSAGAVDPKRGGDGVQRFRRVSWREGVAWLTAAASLFFAVRLWFSSELLDQVVSLPTATESRLAMLKEAPDLVRADWSEGKTPLDESVQGDVIWSNTLQRGYMRFVGLPLNNPAQEQYQLWIIDPERDEEPIDGGVFNISSSGEVVIPIEAKLKVLKPAAFAITIEQPGGVVVSTQERLPLLAKVVY